ncbi:MAG: ATP-dependent 6-phosphofructokinase [Cyanobacteria bacterium NC_groundwater_1444_Ag_S-0.65um_54_12]|nr:ATP-dependent 6-phosphofructokinase [Cyanobacteria bacterium NC_groundwater_1444_Ag_S-0.65um_54_12]
MIKRIAVLTGGGDAPGLNAVIRGVVKTGISTYNWEVLGVRDGGEGLLSSDFVLLGHHEIRNIASQGGTILGTTNRGNPFAYPIKEDGQVKLVDRSLEAVANLRRAGIDALICIGGDGGLKIAHRLAMMGVKVVGVPKTIDNDLWATDQTFGFDTAIQTATSAIDRLSTTAEAHHRVMVVEVMGRDAGWIALHSGIAGSVNAILIPEIAFRWDVIAQFSQQRSEGGKNFSLIVVAEGARPSGGEVILQEEDETAGIRRLGGIGHRVADYIALQTGLETRVTVLGHVQRGGTPTSYDRVLATRYGVEAAHLVAENKFDYMVALRGTQIVPVPLAEATSRLKLVDPDCEIIRVARDLGICFGDAIPSPLAVRT